MGSDVAARFRPFLKPGNTIVDFGCGDGAVLANLQCAERIGVEPNAKPAQVARTHGFKVVAFLDDLPRESVDVVISNHALEHTTNPLRELLEMRRILIPGGQVVLVLPLDDWRVERRYDPTDHNHHLYTWTPQLIGNLIAEADFILDRARIVTRAWPPRHTFFKARMPSWLWELTCAISSVARRRRQVLVVAHKAHSGDSNSSQMPCDMKVAPPDLPGRASP